MMRFIEQYVVECYHNKLGYYHYYCQYWIILMDKQSRWDPTQAAPSQLAYLLLSCVTLYGTKASNIWGRSNVYSDLDIYSFLHLNLILSSWSDSWSSPWWARQYEQNVSLIIWTFEHKYFDVFLSLYTWDF